MSEKKFTVICKKGDYAVIDRNDQLKEIAVVFRLNEIEGNWGYTCDYWCYEYNGEERTNCTKAQALFNALNLFRYKTEENFISYDRMTEIATKMKDCLVMASGELAQEYINEELDLEGYESDFLGLNEDFAEEVDIDEDCEIEEIDLIDGYAEDEDYYPSSTRGDYSPSNPWDAPGMSIKDFI